jgi:hypothetical protein
MKKKNKVKIFALHLCLPRLMEREWVQERAGPSSSF